MTERPTRRKVGAILAVTLVGAISSGCGSNGDQPSPIQQRLHSTARELHRAQQIERRVYHSAQQRPSVQKARAQKQQADRALRRARATLRATRGY